jgi:hypothetical protein
VAREEGLIGVDVSLGVEGVGVGMALEALGFIPIGPSPLGLGVVGGGAFLPKGVIGAATCGCGCGCGCGLEVVIWVPTSSD